MPTYIATVSFRSGRGAFKSEKDDAEVNDILEKLQSDGAKILDVKLSGSHSPWSGNIAHFLIVYEADAPIFEASGQSAN